MWSHIVRTVVCIAIVLGTFAASIEAQQRFNEYASGGQALPANSSNLHILADVTINPPLTPGNAANLVFRGRGGTTFPAGSFATLYKAAGVGQSGVIHQVIGFPPESPWRTFGLAGDF